MKIVFKKGASRVGGLAGSRPPGWEGGRDEVRVMWALGVGSWSLPAWRLVPVYAKRDPRGAVRIWRRLATLDSLEDSHDRSPAPSTDGDADR